jgi:hypothetical protein
VCGWTSVTVSLTHNDVKISILLACRRVARLALCPLVRRVCHSSKTVNNSITVSPIWLSKVPNEASQWARSNDAHNFGVNTSCAGENWHQQIIWFFCHKTPIYGLSAVANCFVQKIQNLKMHETHQISMKIIWKLFQVPCMIIVFKNCLLPPCYFHGNLVSLMHFKILYFLYKTVGHCWQTIYRGLMAKKSNNLLMPIFTSTGGVHPKVMGIVRSGSLWCFIWHLGKSNHTYGCGVINSWPKQFRTDGRTNRRTNVHLI